MAGTARRPLLRTALRRPIARQVASQ